LRSSDNFRSDAGMTLSFAERKTGRQDSTIFKVARPHPRRGRKHGPLEYRDEIDLYGNGIRHYKIL
jgi:hypothetical protein